MYFGVNIRGYIKGYIGVWLQFRVYGLSGLGV